MDEVCHVYGHSFSVIFEMMLNRTANRKFILASKSPRRQELLKGLDIAFEILTKEVDESFPSTLKAEEIALYLCNKKADAFAVEAAQDHIIITADTIVWINNTVLNKPENKFEAVQMLKLISGKTHEVFTGVCLYSAEKRVSFYGRTEVHFRDLDEEEIDYYIEKYKPYDKAGSYGVQEWIGFIGIDNINGCFYNVMGLPLNLLYEQLRKF